jgi:hypothetical protein
MSEPKYKRMILVLKPDDYERLTSVAQRQVRAPEQQAEYYIRRALSRQTIIPKNQEASVT